MKMITPLVSVVLVGLLLSLVSCNGKLAVPPPTSVPGVPQYTLASDLALRAALFNPNPDSIETGHIQTLYSLSSSENSQLAPADKFGTIALSCCCPCNDSKSSLSNLGSSTTRADSTGHCLCPRQIIAIVSNTGTVSGVSVDEQPLESGAAPASDSLINATVFRLSRERTFPDGAHVLRITGNFDGKGMRKYELPVETRNGKIYLRD